MTRVIRGMTDIEEGLAALESSDDRLGAVIRLAGDVPLRLQKPGFEGLANIIVSQMISRAAANSIWERLLLLTGPAIRPDSLLALEEEQLCGVGLSNAKLGTLRAAAHAVESEGLDLERICVAPDLEAKAQLTAIKGIGPWTADIYLMFCAGHADIFPLGDVALQNAVAHGLGLNEKPKGNVLSEIAAAWSPWRSVAARLFWAYYSRQMRRETNVFG